MRVNGFTRSIVLVAVTCVALAALAPPAGLAQDDGTKVKTQATLLPPAGATNPQAKGKAKTLFRDNGQNILQELHVTAQMLERRTDYRILIDGIDFGLFETRGNSGTLTVNFRDPVRGNQRAFPTFVGDTRDFVLIQIINDATGEVVLTGTFEVVDDSD